MNADEKLHPLRSLSSGVDSQVFPLLSSCLLRLSSSLVVSLFPFTVRQVGFTNSRPLLHHGSLSPLVLGRDNGERETRSAAMAVKWHINRNLGSLFAFPSADPFALLSSRVSRSLALSLSLSLLSGRGNSRQSDNDAISGSTSPPSPADTRLDLQSNGVPTTVMDT